MNYNKWTREGGRFSSYRVQTTINLLQSKLFVKDRRPDIITCSTIFQIHGTTPTQGEQQGVAKEKKKNSKVHEVSEQV